MRYGLTELLLVQPGAAGWRPAPDPESPAVRKALELARRGGKLTNDEAMELGLAAISVHGHTRRPASLTAPPPWPQEAGLLVAESLLAAFGEGMRTWRSALVRGPLFIAAMIGLGRLRTRAERAQARRIALTAVTAPQRRFTPHLPLLMAASAVYSVLRLTGRVPKPQRLPWALLAAKDAIQRLDDRRNWRRAYAAAAVLSSQARWSAASSTSGGWAPDTP